MMLAEYFVLMMERVFGMAIQIEPLSAALGARILGLEDGHLERPDPVTKRFLNDAFEAHQVLFFPELNPTPGQHKRLAQIFGEPEVHVEGREEDRATAHYADDENLILVIDSGRNAANFWHTDATFRKEPPSASIIAMRAVPPRGGDTLWLDTYRAFAELPSPVQDMARRLRGIHGHPGVSETNPHPVVRTHPTTGREALWINRGWTTGLEGVPPRQAQPLLGFFFDAMEQPEYTCRWSWSEGDVAIWDNRCTMHYALRDFGDDYREIHRITLEGQAPR
jgi:taurine dioxygenase